MGRRATQRFIILASAFNRQLTDRLVHGATQALRRHGIPGRAIQLVWVPGAFELPVAAARLAVSRPRPRAIIAVGALIRGQTSQYSVIAQAVAQGLAHASVESRVPIGFGVIVAETLAQARQRAALTGARGADHDRITRSSTAGNRGAEAARAALAVARLFDTLT